MTVGELKEKLDRFDDNLEVILRVTYIEGNALSNVDNIYTENYHSEECVFVYGDEDNL